MTDDEAMDIALAQARLAQDDGEVPVGAVVLRDGVVIGVGRNAPIGAHDPTAHAEIAAMRAAASALGNYRLEGCELFVTLEPCAMCSGAMLHARLARVVYGATDPKTGAAGSVCDLFSLPQLNHQTRVLGGTKADACAALLRGFFQQRRVLGRARHPLRDDALRTPDERFRDLQDYPWSGHLLSDLPSLRGLRMHYLDEGGTGSATQLTFLCLHGHDNWSYAYRGMVADWTSAGCRVAVPDLIGFGKSDKPKKASGHTMEWHRQVLQDWVERLDLRNIVLVLQGTGGPLGMTLRASDPSRYRGMVLVDAALDRAGVVWPDDARPVPSIWERAALADVVALLNADVAAAGEVDAEARAAPFPDRGHRMAERALIQWPGHGELPPPGQAAWLTSPPGLGPKRIAQALVSLFGGSSP